MGGRVAPFDIEMSRWLDQVSGARMRLKSRAQIAGSGIGPPIFVAPHRVVLGRRRQLGSRQHSKHLLYSTVLCTADRSIAIRAMPAAR